MSVETKFDKIRFSVVCSDDAFVAVSLCTGLVEMASAGMGVGSGCLDVAVRSV